MKATLYTDGGARVNPGPAGIGFVLKFGGREIKRGTYIGEATNNQAEYRALMAGLQAAAAEGVSEMACYLDSELLVKHLSGEYRVRDADLRPLYERVCRLVKLFSRITFTHVPREKNKAADRLVNEAIDQSSAAGKKAPRG
ncbi:MAG: ribonuclease HI family protein [Candidatus Andersenbacteria bacterium]|nr:ribonuclease HI family protein [Candidatus Andersenbacteria bacterium]